MRSKGKRPNGPPPYGPCLFPGAALTEHHDLGDSQQWVFILSQWRRGWQGPAPPEAPPGGSLLSRQVLGPRRSLSCGSTAPGSASVPLCVPVLTSSDRRDIGHVGLGPPSSRITSSQPATSAVTLFPNEAVGGGIRVSTYLPGGHSWPTTRSS